MNTTESTTECRTVTANVTVCKVISDGAVVEISTRLTYDPSDPFAVAATFYTASTPVTWVFGRDLLDEGTNQPVGEGDMLVWPSLDTEGGAVVILELDAPGEPVLMQVRTSDIHGFLLRTFVEVPRGQEPELLDTDALIDALLGEPC